MSLSLHLQSLHRQQRLLLSGVDLHIATGQILTVMGPSGCGKSSLLAAIAGLESESLHLQGTLHLHGQGITHLPTEQRRIGLLFQDDLLFAHWTVGENLLFAVPAGPLHARWAAVHQALAQADLAGYADRDPATLSGGQRARVALLRALLAQPRALLLDEPFARLDTALRVPLRAWVYAHLREQGIPALLVTHDPSDIADAGHVWHWPRLEPPSAHA
jgi:putative thiamine transport system ATP-binding protein